MKKQNRVDEKAIRKIVGRVIKEAVEGQQGADPSQMIEPVSDVADSNYPQALKLLQTAAANVTPQNNAAFRQALVREAQEMGVNSVSVQPGKIIPIAGLKPTQNEIGINVTVDYTVFGNGKGNGSGAKCKAYFEGKGGWDKNGRQAPILVTDGGLIIDGHHRWSQVMLINPKGKIMADVVSFKGSGSADRVLTLSQMSILDDNLAAGNANIPSAEALGENLLKGKGAAVKARIDQHGGLPGNGKIPGDFIQVMWPLMVGNNGGVKSMQKGQQQQQPAQNAGNENQPAQQDANGEQQNQLAEAMYQNNAGVNRQPASKGMYGAGSTNANAWSPQRIKVAEQQLIQVLVQHGNMFPNPPKGSTKRDSMPQFDQSAGGQKGAIGQLKDHLGNPSAAGNAGTSGQMAESRRKKKAIQINENTIRRIVAETLMNMMK